MQVARRHQADLLLYVRPSPYRDPSCPRSRAVHDDPAVLDSAAPAIQSLYDKTTGVGQGRSRDLGHQVRQHDGGRGVGGVVFGLSTGGRCNLLDALLVTGLFFCPLHSPTSCCVLSPCSWCSVLLSQHALQCAIDAVSPPPPARPPRSVGA